jgi:hypothetical protein
MTAPELSARELKWLSAVPLQFEATAGEIARRAGQPNAQRFAAFAKRHNRLVQRQFSKTGFYYRLSDDGRALLGNYLNP